MTTTRTEIADQWCCETCRRLSAANIDGRGHVLSRAALDLAEEAERLRTERDQFRDSALMYAARVAELNDEIVKLRAAQQEETPQATTTCPSPQCDRLVASPNTYCCTACRGVGGGLHSEGCNARRAERAAQREESTR